MPETRYTLTLSVEGDDNFTINVKSDAFDFADDEMALSLAFDVGRLLNFMEISPAAADLVSALPELHKCRIFALLGTLHGLWSVDHNFDDAFTLIVDVDKLCSDDEKSKESARSHIRFNDKVAKEA